MQVRDRLFDCLARGPSVAPGVARTVVRADTRGVGEFRLYEEPVDGKRAATHGEDDRWAAGAGTVEVQLATADVYQTTRCRVCRPADLRVQLRHCCE